MFSSSSLEREKHLLMASVDFSAWVMVPAGLYLCSLLPFLAHGEQLDPVKSTSKE